MEKDKIKHAISDIEAAARMTYNGSIINLVEKLTKLIDTFNDDMERHIISIENIEDRLLSTSCHYNDANEMESPVGNSAKPENVILEKTLSKKL